jgi:hypothetical protein
MVPLFICCYKIRKKRQKGSGQSNFSTKNGFLEAKERDKKIRKGKDVLKW